MKAAVELARELLRKENAIKKTKSENLKRDYTKSINEDKNELLFYCRNRKLDIKKVFEEAKRNM